MASDVVYDAIRAYLTANWTEDPVQYENESFNVPPDRKWVAVELSGSVYGQQSIGSDDQAGNRWDEDGILWLHVHTKTGTGSSDLRRRCKALADLFRGALLLSDSLEFMDASIGMGDVPDEGGDIYRISVMVDWRRMEA